MGRHGKVVASRLPSLDGGPNKSPVDI